MGGEEEGGSRVRASTVALHKSGSHDDGNQEGEGAGCLQRDARTGRGGGVGRTAEGACCHGSGVGVGGGVSSCCGVCAVIGHHLFERGVEEE